MILNRIRGIARLRDFKKTHPAKLKVFCVTHAPPLVPDSLTDYIIGIGEYYPPAARGSHICELDSFWHEMRPYAYGAAGNYAIPKAIDVVNPAELTGIFSHRKIVTRGQIGKPSTESGFYYDVEVDEAARVPRHEIEPREGHEFLVGFPVKFEWNIVHNYIDAHYGIDLFEYISMAMNMGILTVDEVQAFAKEQLFVPGGCESGIYPTAWIKPVIEKLAALGREFIVKNGERILSYDDYQVRVVGFLAERLGSFLLLAELRRRYPKGLPRELCGYLSVIVPKGDKYIPARV